MEISLIKEYMALVCLAMESMDDAFLVSQSCSLVYEHLYHYQSARFWRILRERQLKFHRKKDFNLFLRLLEPGLTDFDAEKMGLILGILDSDDFSRSFSNWKMFSQNIKFVLKIFDRLDIHFLDLIPNLWGDVDLEIARPKLKVTDDFLELRERALGQMRPRLVSFAELYIENFRISMWKKNGDFLSAGIEFYHLIESRSGSQSFFTFVRETDLKSYLLNVTDMDLIIMLLQYHRFMSKIGEERGWKGVSVEAPDEERDPLATDLFGLDSLNSNLDFLEIENSISAESDNPIRFRISKNASFQSTLDIIIYMSEISERKVQSKQDPRNKFVSVDFDKIFLNFITKNELLLSKMLCRDGMTWSELLCILDTMLKVKNSKHRKMKMSQISHKIQLTLRLICFRCLESEPNVQNLEVISRVRSMLRDNEVTCPQFEEFLDRFEEGAGEQELADLYVKFRFAFKKDLISIPKHTFVV